MARELGGLFLLCKVAEMPAVAAELTIGDLTFEAKALGTAGNATTMEFIDGATAGAEVVTVTVDAIKVEIEEGVSTAEQVKKAIDNLPAAYAKVKTIISGDIDGLPAVHPATAFQFGYDATTTPQMLAGLRTKKLTLGAEAIDVSNHSSDNYKTILDKAGLRSFSMDAGGVATQTDVFNQVSIICEKNLLQEFLLVDVANQITRRGKFKISSIEKSADFKAEQTFGMKLESSGRLTKNKATASEMDDSI